ncbi:type IV secretion system protein [Caballeronia zhejiangensis]|uniref:Type VI secretion protein n=1 Tax=Caballeronia zhejiangensis TaxID=871203 RepID=A0A656QD11_9BURK|nr:putative type IV secretion system protein VirB5 [Burkholderia sp. SJ98]KDR26182.1 hypothetical protein BG60_23915 [Caballeronia zhejiangensis]
MTVRNTLLAIALGVTLSASVPIYATGIPTFDAATFLQLQQQLSQLQDQYRTLKDQYAAVTGSYGRGSIGLNQSINAASVVPGSWQEVVSQQQSGTFGARQNFYEKLINTLPQDVFADPSAQNATTYKMSTDSVRAALAGGDSLYSEVQTHLNNLSVLSQQVDTTTNVKDAQDLQNRIASENGMLSSAMAKLNAMNMNLQANLVNQQNQATAGNQKFYQWKK